MVYSSALRPLLPKASLWTGSTPWSWARAACYHLPPSPRRAPHRVSAPKTAICQVLWAWVALQHLTWVFLKSKAFQMWSSLCKWWKMSLNSGPGLKKKLEKNEKKLHGNILRAEDTKHSHECRHVFTKKKNHLISSLTKDLLLFIFFKSIFSSESLLL